MVDINTLYNEDCLVTMNRMRNDFIDLVVTSPPYDDLRKYNGYCFDAEKTIRELYRVIKSGGVVVWVVGDATIKGSETGTSFRQALYSMSVGFRLHDTMIYQKENPIPQFRSHRYTNSFEYMFIFSKGKPLGGKLILEKTKLGGRIDRRYRGQRLDTGKYKTKKIKAVKEYKKRSNIWKYSSNNGIDRLIDFPAQCPELLVRDHIMSWSNEGDIVYDPFMGSGTTAKMAILNNRNWLGSEISEEYCKITEERISNLGEIYG